MSGTNQPEEQSPVNDPVPETETDQSETEELEGEEDTDEEDDTAA